MNYKIIHFNKKMQLNNNFFKISMKSIYNKRQNNFQTKKQMLKNRMIKNKINNQIYNDNNKISYK